MSKKVAVYGMLVALAFLLSYVETLIPFSFAIGKSSFRLISDPCAKILLPARRRLPRPGWSGHRR